MKKFFVVLLAVACVFMFASCSKSSSGTSTSSASAPAASSSSSSSSTATKAPVVKDVLRIAAQSDGKSYDPAMAVDVHSSVIYGSINETLLKLDENKNIIPGLADYEVIDDVTYKFNLKKGIYFTNGEELKASDVVFTMLRGRDTALLAFLFGSISDAVALDDYTVQVTLKQPSAPFLSAMTALASGIVNEKAVKEAGDSYGIHPVGTGPYKLNKWEQGVQVVLDRNEEYWGEKPAYKQVVIKPIPEGTNRTIELESGNVDVAFDIPVTDHARVQAASNLRLEKQEAATVRYIGFNCSFAPFDDPRVREAIALAIDTEGLTWAINRDTAVVTNAPVSPAIMFYQDEVSAHEYNPEKAKQILKDAGYENISFTILTDERKEYLDIATIAQAQLKEIGIDAKIEVLEWATYLSRVYGGESQMYVIGWSCQTPDPDTVMYAVFHSSMKGNGGNMSYYDNPEADRLLELGRTTSDYEARKQIYFDLQKLLIKDRPWIYLYTQQFVVGVSDKIESITLDATGSHPVWKIK